jgi:hypothetical protein
MKNLMWRKPTSLENFRKDQGSTKASFLSNVLIVENLVILHPSVPIPRRTPKKKKKKTNNTRRRKNPTTRKISREGKRISTQKKKTTTRQSLVTTMNLMMINLFS